MSEIEKLKITGVFNGKDRFYDAVIVSKQLDAISIQTIESGRSTKSDLTTSEARALADYLIQMANKIDSEYATP
jgi:hypothetical protein